jgi:hypothetical protein
MRSVHASASIPAQLRLSSGSLQPLLSLFGTRGAALLRFGLHASTFLPCLPSDGVLLAPPLMVRAPDHIGTMRALTPCRLAHANKVSPFRSSAFPASRPQPRYAARRSRAYHPVPPVGPRGPDFAINEQARLCTPPNRVRHPTGRRFASGCSPPRLAATQLPSATCAVTSHGTDSHRADITNSRTHSLPRLTGQSSTPGLCLPDRPVEPDDDSEVCVNLSEKRSRIMSSRSIL